MASADALDDDFVIESSFVEPIEEIEIQEDVTAESNGIKRSLSADDESDQSADQKKSKRVINASKVVLKC